MDLNKIFKICKGNRRFLVFNQDKKTQWLGDGVASYLVTDAAKLTPEYLTASASLKPQEVEITLFRNSDLPDEFDVLDSTDDETAVHIIEWATIKFGDEEYVMAFTSKGIRFVKAYYFQPFEKEEYELYERTTEDGEMYFVVKLGMFVSAIIRATDDYIDVHTVSLFEKIAQNISLAYSLIEMPVTREELD